MPAINFEVLKKMLKLTDVFRLLGYHCTMISGDRGRGPCPSPCSVKPRCCSLNLKTNLWFCHRCGRGGGVLDFYMAPTSARPYDAAIRLCERLAIPVPTTARSKLRQPRAARKRRKPLDEPDGSTVE